MTMNHREWKPGMRLQDRGGFQATLLAPTWNGWAWLIYDDSTYPQSVETWRLAPVDSQDVTVHHRHSV